MVDKQILPKDEKYEKHMKKEFASMDGATLRIGHI